jgi:hypothetical protein
VHRNNSRRAVGILAAGACALGLLAALLLAGPFKGDRAASNSRPAAGAPSVPSASASASAASPSPALTPSLRSAGPKPPATPKPNRRAGQRLLTMVNRTARTIWPAVAADPKHPIKATGWRLPPGGKVSVVLPDHWDARVWARTGCSGDTHCVTGDCGGRFQCGSHWGALPATLAEFNLNAWRGMDFYDVSLVDGSNLPMYINHTGGHTPDKISPTGCVAAGCTHDANATCPRTLRVTHGGAVVACRSACVALNTDQTCCRGEWAPRPKCVPSQWPIDSAAVFKRAEPFAYSYVNDDATSVFTCSGLCDYRITFGRSPH